MPEGHTIHRLARQQQRLFGGRTVRACSPQGRFSAGAQRLDGQLLWRAEAYGKHLFHRYQPAGGPQPAGETRQGGTRQGGTRPVGAPPGAGLLLHVHLGLYGAFRAGGGEPPPPRGAVRLRLVGAEHWADLRAPTACELIDDEQRAALLARLGPDPLRRDADPGRAAARLARSRTPVAALLMDQAVLAGVGNVYRAELLFRHRVDPLLPGRELDVGVWSAMWTDLVGLLRAGARSGRIVTVLAEDRPCRGPLGRADAVYVYRRTGAPCRRCGTEVRSTILAARTLYWCPACQPPGAGRG